MPHTSRTIVSQPVLEGHSPTRFALWPITREPLTAYTREQLLGSLPV
ncbi:hypothetical protein ACFYRD_35140 [Streptomyces hirsutus]